ncbi:autotransporter domain-containing protein [Herbaspirillum sp. alder98]|uniref:autotransporter domain-containing protein n=1 Tax=Herbaspirillum sp. alder98 TaxID=2913096 RepID=UPI001CD83933|nr:autotransporter domain-containing protein [Herbaspirillum sp. alder98]MCA1325101.1 autotransporter domain-containing protein [Herbaspirillum sp. alder98]
MTATPRTMNAAGNIFAGQFDFAPGQEHAFRWSPISNSMVDMGTLGGSTSSAFGINATGDIIVGQAAIAGDAATHAFVWTAATGFMRDIGTLGGTYGAATGVSRTGDVVAGASTIAGGSMHAFRWTAASGVMNDLGTLGGTTSSALALSAAGDVVVGYAYLGDNTTRRAFRWTLASGVMDNLGSLGGTSSSASATNAAGDVVVGYSTLAGGTSSHAFRWSVASNRMEDIGAPGSAYSSATGTNATGDVVIGNFRAVGNATGQGFRWTSAAGMQSIEDWLTAQGVTVGNVRTTTANAINAEGNVIVGTLSNGHVYLARVASSSAGLLDVEDFNAGLARVSNSGLLAANDAETVMNGLHSNPMAMLLAPGRATFWVSGDAGRQTHSPYSSKLGIAEIGYGYRPSRHWQLNLAAGRSYSQADTGMGGRTSTRSTYVAPEVILSLPASSYLTLSGYYGQGRADIDRVYLNAGLPQGASGNPDQNTVGGRLRLDAVDLARLGKTRLTPYASLTWLRTRTAGYREQGGAFPVDWRARVDRSTTARIGIDALYPVTAATTLQLRTEAAHRFEKTGATTSGEVIGLYGFNFAGQDIKRDWLRFGLGAQSRMGDGIASMMLNATTQGEASSYWVSASYRWEF